MEWLAPRAIPRLGQQKLAEQLWRVIPLALLSSYLGSLMRGVG